MTLGPLMIDVAGPALTAEDRELLRRPLVGGVILFTRNYTDPAQLAALTAEIHGLRTPPLIVAVDQEGGRVQRFRAGFAALPSAHRVGQEFELSAAAGTDCARTLGWLMAAQLRSCGVDLSFAPVVDLDYGLNEAIGTRAFHAAPDIVGALAVAYMQGMREAGMAATAKHFPGHGAVAADSHLQLPVDRREWADLAADLAPYRRLLANGLPGIMVAHILLPQVDAAAPASLSRRWVHGVLRGEMHFQGAVFSDDLSMGAAAAGGDIVERSRRALDAGCDMLLICNDRAGAARTVEQLDREPDPTAHLRLMRMRGREARSAQQLHASEQWHHAQEVLARLAAAPALHLTEGRA